MAKQSAKPKTPAKSQGRQLPITSFFTRTPKADGNLHLINSYPVEEKS
jgi:hypothetical protein